MMKLAIYIFLFALFICQFQYFASIVSSFYHKPKTPKSYTKVDLHRIILEFDEHNSIFDYFNKNELKRIKKNTEKMMSKVPNEYSKLKENLSKSIQPKVKTWKDYCNKLLKGQWSSFRTKSRCQLKRLLQKFDQAL